MDVTRTTAKQIKNPDEASFQLPVMPELSVLGTQTNRSENNA